MDITLLTATWNNEDQFEIEKTSLYRSFKKFNPHKEVIHRHFNRGKFHELEGQFRTRFGEESEYILYKIFLMIEEAKNVKSEYVLFCDANDVTCMASVDHLETFFDLDNFVICGQEKNTWPTQEKKASWPDYRDYSQKEVQNETYINSGMILAKTSKYINMLQSMVDNVLSKEIKTFANDQGVFTYYYNNKIDPPIKLDCSNAFATSTFKRNKDEFYVDKNRRLVIKETGVKPCFVHDNGWNHGSPRLHNEFELKRLYSESYAHLKNISENKPIGQDHQDYLKRLRDEFGFSPKVIYDIGACVLHWTKMSKELWPDAQYFLFEAMEESEELFQETNHQYHIGVFSDEDDKEVTFYKNTCFPGGNSYYMENPKESSMASALFENPANQFKRKTVKLDTIRRQRNFPYPDLLKIDVQGCEVDILNGAKDILANVKHLIVELQHVEYNIGAKLCHESIPIIESMGFRLVTPKFSLSSHADADYHFEKI
jgi:FkbM family methyltransferase